MNKDKRELSNWIDNRRQKKEIKESAKKEKVKKPKVSLMLSLEYPNRGENIIVSSKTISKICSKC